MEMFVGSSEAPQLGTFYCSSHDVTNELLPFWILASWKSTPHRPLTLYHPQAVYLGKRQNDCMMILSHNHFWFRGKPHTSLTL